jgi:ribosome-associated protein YbcJ (S4-like RNA binding protein)
MQNVINKQCIYFRVKLEKFIKLLGMLRQSGQDKAFKSNTALASPGKRTVRRIN